MVGRGGMVIDIECVVQRAVNGNCSWLAIRSSRLAKIAIPPKGGSYVTVLKSY
jgi:hypothetical protein